MRKPGEIGFEIGTILAANAVTQIEHRMDGSFTPRIRELLMGQLAGIFKRLYRTPAGELRSAAIDSRLENMERQRRENNNVSQ